MSKTKRQKLIQEKRRMAEHWGRYPVLSELYETPEQYAEALKRIDQKVKTDESREEFTRLIRR